MAKKLKNMTITSVDLCPQGANPDAYIEIYKSTLPEKRQTNLLNSVLQGVGRLLGKSPAEIEKAVTVTKADSFKELVVQRDMDRESWDYIYALRDSFDSIRNDKEIENEQKKVLMMQSVDQFCGLMKKKISNWFDGSADSIAKLDDEKHLEILQDLKNQLECDIEMLQKSKTNTEGEIKNMDFVKENMSAEDRAILEGLEKKYDIQTEGAGTVQTSDTKGDVEKGVKSSEVNPGTGNDEVLKSEIAELRKALERRDQMEIAKKYELLGKKPEELADMLVKMKEAGEDVYKSYVQTLDDALEMTEKAGIFKEAGSGNSGDVGTSARSKIHLAAEELRKSHPELTKEAAYVKACEEHPELVSEYENQR